jgi:hypothetical protein
LLPSLQEYHGPVYILSCQRVTEWVVWKCTEFLIEVIINIGAPIIAY